MGFEKFIGRNPFDLHTIPSTFSSLSYFSLPLLTTVALLWTSIYLLPCTIGDDSAIAALRSDVAIVVFRTDIIDDDITVIVLRTDVTTVVLRADVGATIPVVDDYAASSDLFGHPLTETPPCRSFLRSFNRRTSQTENSHWCSLLTHDHHCIRKVKPFDLPPRPKFSFYVGEFCFGFDFPFLIACGWTMFY